MYIYNCKYQLLFLLHISDFCSILDWEYFLFADDLKLFTTINSIANFIILQNKILKLHSRWYVNKFHLNISKCCTMIYCRIRDPLIFSYVISDVTINRCTLLKNLDIIFDIGFRFDDQVNGIVSPTTKLLDFIISNIFNLKIIGATKIFFFIFNRSRVEYCSIIRNLICNS